MNKRSREMLTQIITKTEYGQPITIEDAARIFGVSVRTVRYDIEQINHYLEGLGLLPLMLGRKGLINASPNIRKAKSALSQEGFYAIRLSREERLCFQAIILICQDGYVSLNDLAEHLFVSRSTVVQDQPALRDFLKEHRLYLYAYANKGLLIEGTESDRRRMIVDLIPRFRTIFREPQVYQHLLESIRGQNDDYIEDREIIEKILKQAENLHEIEFTDTSYFLIVVYLELSLFRVRRGYYAEPQEKTRSSKLPLARTIMEKYAQYMTGELPDSEAQLLARLLSRMRYIKRRTDTKEIVKIQVVTMDFIDHLSEELGIALRQDYIFYENLVSHLASTFAAIGETSSVNEVVENVVDQFPEIKAAAGKYICILEAYLGRKIREGEFVYILIHICAAVERMKNKPVHYSVVLVCGSGIGTARMLQARLEKYFRVNIVDVIAAHSIPEFHLDSVDAVISTISLARYDIDYIQVSPMLSDEDCIRVGNRLAAISQGREKSLSETAAEDTENLRHAEAVLDLIRDTMLHETDDRETLRKIQDLLDGYYSKNELTLEDLLPTEHICFDVAAADWKEAIRNTADLLVENGYITTGYVDGMIRNVEENGPYIVLAPGFALAHEALDAGAIYRGMTLARLKEPVIFGKEDMDPVEWICCLSATDRISHCKPMFQLMNLMFDETYRASLQACGTPEEASSVIREYIREKGDDL